MCLTCFGRRGCEATATTSETPGKQGLTCIATQCLQNLQVYPSSGVSVTRCGCVMDVRFVQQFMLHDNDKPGNVPGQLVIPLFLCNGLIWARTFCSQTTSCGEFVAAKTIFPISRCLKQWLWHELLKPYIETSGFRKGLRDSKSLFGRLRDLEVSGLMESRGSRLTRSAQKCLRLWVSRFALVIWVLFCTMILVDSSLIHHFQKQTHSSKKMPCHSNPSSPNPFDKVVNTCRSSSEKPYLWQTCVVPST